MPRNTSLLALASQNQPEEAAALKPIPPAQPKKSESRKHIGGYFDHDTAKRLAMLKAESGKTTQELLERALELLFAEAKTQSRFRG